MNLFESCLVYERTLAGRDVRMESVASRSSPSSVHRCLFLLLCFVSVRPAVCTKVSLCNMQWLQKVFAPHSNEALSATSDSISI